MLHVVKSALAEPDETLTVVLIRCDRMKLSKRLWRGMAEDGVEFGVEADKPVRHGQTIYQHGGKRYVVEQLGEPVLEVSLDLAASVAAGIGWAVGNLHLELMSEPHRLLTPDSPGARKLLEKLGISYTAIEDRFYPGRFARQAKIKAVLNHEFGSSHQH